MDIRKSATALNKDEKDAFLEAIIKMKARRAPNTAASVSVYDQFVALHGAVMAVTKTGNSRPINFAHGNIGFLPWHRQYLRLFELALQREVTDVTLPYWDWSDDVGAVTELFTAEFLSSRSWGRPSRISDGLLRARVPNSEKPSWWPSSLQGFVVDRNMQEGLGSSLRRGSTESSWPPSVSQMNQLATLDIPIRGSNPLWAFWLVLEQGFARINPNTHNSGHRFIGGHMGGSFSPNDPIFWMHHANVDRTWALWQDTLKNKNAGSSPSDFWPSSAENSPINGRPAPEGHKINDALWPWVGNKSDQYRSTSASRAILNRLQDFSGSPAVKVSDVLDFEAMGFKYA